MRAVVEALRIPRSQRPQLVDNPAIVGGCARPVDALLQKQLDVVEEEAPAILERHRACQASAEQVHRLRQNPGIAEHAAANEDASDARFEPPDDLLRLDAVAAAEHGD